MVNVGPARILIVDDEPAILRAVQTNLTRHGFAVAAATTGAEARDLLERWEPGVVLLDLGLPDEDGLAIIGWARARSELPPIIVLSARTTEREKVTALTLGADDYLTKPFGMDELLARVRVALRHRARAASPAGDTVTAGDLLIDMQHRRVALAGREVHLTPIEWALLALLVKNADRVLTHRRLLQQVWGPEYGDEGHYLHVHIANLRRKIETDPRSPRHLLTEPGAGYRFRLGDDDHGPATATSPRS